MEEGKRFSRKVTRVAWGLDEEFRRRAEVVTPLKRETIESPRSRVLPKRGQGVLEQGEGFGVYGVSLRRIGRCKRPGGRRTSWDLTTS